MLSLYGAGRDSLRLPCFLRGRGLLVLPAFGEFTGGWAWRPERGASFTIVDRVWRLPESEPAALAWWCFYKPFGPPARRYMLAWGGSVLTAPPARNHKQPYCYLDRKMS